MQGISFAMMKAQIEPMQQPVRKVVGRRNKAVHNLARLEQLNAFIYKFAKNEFPAGEFFPIRKTVGRTRAGRC
jgi:hypothetical protein